MRVKIINKNHKIRKSLDRINENNNNNFFDPSIDTIIVDELDLNNGRYNKTDDIKLTDKEFRTIFENGINENTSVYDESKKHVAKLEKEMKDEAKYNNTEVNKIDPYFKYTDEPGDPNEILERPDLQIYEPNQRFQRVIKRLPLDVIRKEALKAWNGTQSSLIKGFGKHAPNDEKTLPPSELIDHGGYHTTIISGMGPVVTPAGLDEVTRNALDSFVDDFIYTGKISEIKNNPNIIMVRQETASGPIYKTINLKPIKVYIKQMITLISKTAGHLAALVGKLQIFFVTNVPTMATDGFRIFINPAFVHTLYTRGDHEGVLYVLVHELYHNFLMHHARTFIRYEEFKMSNLANIAQDLEINHLIEKEFPMLKGQTLKQGGCWEPETEGMTWEEIYKDKELMMKLSREHAMKTIAEKEINDSIIEVDDDNSSSGTNGGQDSSGGDSGSSGGSQDSSGGDSGSSGGSQDSSGGNGDNGGEITEDFTPEEIVKIVNTLKNNGYDDIAVKIENSGITDKLLNNFTFDFNRINFNGIISNNEISITADIMRGSGEIEIAQKLDGLLQSNDGQGSQGTQTGQSEIEQNDQNGQDKNASGHDGTEGGSEPQVGENGERVSDKDKNNSGDKQKPDTDNNQSVSREELEKHIEKLIDSGDVDSAKKLQRMKQEADRNARGGSSGTTMSAQDLLDAIEGLEASGQQEAADNLRKQIAEAHNRNKRQRAINDGTYDESEQELTDMKPSEVDEMLRKQSGKGPATKQDGYDGSDKHTDHRDVLTPEEGDKILDDSKQNHEQRTQTITDKQLGDYKDLKGEYEQTMNSAIGSLIGDIISKLTAELKPAVNWKQRLASFMKTNITPEGRRAWNKKALLRGDYVRRRRDTRDSGESVLAIIDVSGSVYHSSGNVHGKQMNPMITQFISEICSIAISCSVKYVYVLTFDGEVHFNKMQRLNQSQMQRISKNPKRFELEFMGGGATNFPAAIESLHTRQIKSLNANVVILFTDGSSPGDEKNLPPLPRNINKRAFLWFVSYEADGTTWNEDFKPDFGQVVKVIPGKGMVNESVSTKYKHRNKIRKERARKLYESKIEQNPLYHYIHNGKYYSPQEFSPANVERIPFNRIESYDKGYVKTSNRMINEHIKLYRLFKDFNSLIEVINEREKISDSIYNNINENVDIDVDDINIAIARSIELDQLSQ